MSASERPPRIDDFLGDPTREPSDWRWLWTENATFPIRSHRGLVGRALVFLKRLFRPLVVAPQTDLWERQRVFNLILLETLDQARHHRERNESRVEHLEAFPEIVMRHNDALFARVDQKLDRYRRQTGDLLETLGEAIAVVDGDPRGPSSIARAHADFGYRDFEDRFRGVETEIRARVDAHLSLLEGLDPVLDLGCGRGEALAVLGAAGHQATGVDGNTQMIAACREQGLEAEAADLFEYLASLEPESQGAIVSFHVIEHLDPSEIDRLVRLAHRALKPGGRLLLETPNPLSVVVAARNFWLDPTHRRPVHPHWLVAVAEQAGFHSVEHRDLHPFPAPERLPELPPGTAPAELADLVDQINRLRDELDDLLFGAQDYLLVAEK